MFSRQARRLLVPAVAVGLTLTACGSSSGSEPSAAAPAATANAETASSSATNSAPSASADAASGTSAESGAAAGTSTAAPAVLQFAAPLVGGGEIDAATLAAGQPVLFWFWAPY